MKSKIFVRFETEFLLFSLNRITSKENEAPAITFGELADKAVDNTFNDDEFMKWARTSKR